MRLALIGSTGHWHTYAQALEQVPSLMLVAVAAAGPEESTGAFDHAPGLTVDTRRYDDARKMLDTQQLDVVQVSARCDRIPHWAKTCLERGLAVMAEKPLAMDLATLEELFHTAQKTKAALVPMHTMRGVKELAAVRQAVRAGDIGEPLLSFSQKSYKWGKTRPDDYRSRKTFPGIAPWVGIHAFDWLHATSATCSRRFPAVKRRLRTRDIPPAPAMRLSCWEWPTAAWEPSHSTTCGPRPRRLTAMSVYASLALKAWSRPHSSTTKSFSFDPANARTLPLVPQPDIFTQFVRSLSGQSPAAAHAS